MKARNQARIKTLLVFSIGLVLSLPSISSCASPENGGTNNQIDVNIADILTRLDQLKEEVRSLKSEYQSKIEELNAKHTEEMNALNNKIGAAKDYMVSVEETYNSAISELNDEIKELLQIYKII